MNPTREIRSFFCIFALCLWLCACGDKKPETQQAIPNSEKNPIDTIVGDKILHQSTGKIRSNNFSSLIGLDKKYLQRPSLLYEAKEIYPNYFILRQKKNYSLARHFNMLIATDEQKITKFLAFEDFTVVDIKRDSSSWIVLLSDFNQTNAHWKSKQQIRIEKIDADFQKVWEYRRRNDIHLLNGREIISASNEYLFSIEVITGCHICYELVELRLDKNGNFLSVHKLHNHNSSDVDSETLKKIFE